MIINFVEKAKGFDNNEKLKLILFLTSSKPATFTALKINPKNLEEKAHFEKHLKKKKILFNISRAKGFEQINKISKGKIHWKLNGIWYGYDLFKSKTQQQLFKKYISMIKKHKVNEADKVAGKLYGYPSCCIKEFIKENNPDYITKKYSYYKYYKRLQDTAKKFPLLLHTPCSTTCKTSAKFNKKHEQLLKKQAPKFWKDFSTKKILKTDFIVDSQNDILDNPVEGKSIWSKKDGYEYNLIAKTPFNKHFYLFTYLTKKPFKRGTILQGKAIMQYNRATIKITKTKSILKQVVHLRRFILPNKIHKL